MSLTVASFPNNKVCSVRVCVWGGGGGGFENRYRRFSQFSVLCFFAGDILSHKYPILEAFR